MKKSLLTIFKRALLSFLVLGTLSISAQKVKRITYKYDHLNYPKVAMDGVSSYTLKIFTGNLKLSESDIKGKKTFKKLKEIQFDKKYHTFSQPKLVNNGGDISIEIALGSFKQTGKVKKTRKIPCKQKGAKMTKDNIKECDAHYYEISYDLPSVIKITNKDSKLLYAKKLDGSGSYKFGYDKNGLSGYLVVADLAAAFTKSGTKGVEKDAALRQIGLANRTIKECLYFSTTTDAFKIGTGKGKNFDYSALENAAENAVSILKNGSNLDGLSSSIDTWVIAVKEADIGNKNAKINKKIATSLNGNLAIAYMYTNQFEAAKPYAEEYNRLASSAVDQAIPERARTINRLISEREQIYKVNNSLNTSGEKIAAANLLSSITDKKNVESFQFLASGDKFEEFLTVANKLNSSKKAEESKASTASAASGSNKYKNRIGSTATQGNQLLMNAFFDKDLVGKELPSEICDLVELNQLNATAMKLTKLPENIGNLKNLKILNLQNNQFTSIPESIGNLTSLKSLNLANNKLTSLPESIKNCTTLKSLKLKGNNISSGELAKIQSWLPNCKIK